MTQLRWKETRVLSFKNRKMVDKNRVAYSLSSVMLFNAKIGKHNYSFSLKHKFNLQTAFRSPAQSSFLILHSNCSRAHSRPWSQSFVGSARPLHLSISCPRRSTYAVVLSCNLFISSSFMILIAICGTRLHPLLTQPCREAERGVVQGSSAV